MATWFNRPIIWVSFHLAGLVMPRLIHFVYGQRGAPSPVNAMLGKFWHSFPIRSRRMTMPNTATLPFAVRGTADKPLLGLTILLVEDSRFSSEAVRIMSLRSGVRLRRADCITSARRHMRLYRPSIAIVDVARAVDDTDLVQAAQQGDFTRMR